MKKIVFSLVAFLTLIVLNFNSESFAATKHTYNSQDVTAYTGITCGHGCTYGFYNQQYKTVAVHKYASNEPYIPFGTICLLNTALLLPTGGGMKTNGTFSVTDTGSGLNKSYYWLDVYYGLTNSTNYYWANQFGTNKNIKVSYTATF